MQSIFLLIEPGFEQYKSPILRDLVESCPYPVVIATGLSRTVPCDWARKYSTHWIEFDYTSDSSFDEVAEQLAAHGFRAVGAATYVQTSIVWVNEFQHRFGLPFISEIRGTGFRDKGEVRRRLTAASVGQVRYEVVHSVEECRNFSWGFEKPVIVKPTDMMASLAVSKVRSQERLEAAVELAATADFEGEDLRKLQKLSSTVIIEEYVDGPEYSVECFVQKGRTIILGITAKHVSDDGSFNEIGHSFPTELPPKISERIYVLAEEVNSALRIRNSFTHLEMRVRDGIPFLIEANCRLGGDLISELISRSLGISLGEMLARVHSGELVDLKKAEANAQVESVVFHYPIGEGCVTSETMNRIEIPFCDVGHIALNDRISGAHQRLGASFVKGALSNVNELCLVPVQVLPVGDK